MAYKPYRELNKRTNIFVLGSFIMNILKTEYVAIPSNPRVTVSFKRPDPQKNADGMKKAETAMPKCRCGYCL